MPYSTNVERVALAFGHKGLDVEWVDVDPSDRTEVDRVSGQSLVPVLVDGDRVVTDSTEILRHLEQLSPEPPLFPVEPARRAELEVFLDWFNRVWKRPPNEIEAQRGKPQPDEELIDALGRELTDGLDLFEHLLEGREYLYGEFSAADCAAFPFLKYALDRDAADDESFHAILREFLQLGEDHRRLARWIERVDARPRA
ncbi:MAG: glutathione S-transferase family protein [Actinobacteria bacterium]|nr:glutathione S-transferase family protein [Actinomycetota bacterium]